MVICITGATDGIGRELARQYASRPNASQSVRLILIGRRPLETLDPGIYQRQNYCEADLGDPGAAIKVAKWLTAHGIDRLNLLIHNAGVGYVGALPKQTDESIISVLQINLQAPIALSHALLPWLGQGGKLVFIGSIASDLPSPDYAVYSASKAALNGLARNLRTEFSAPRSAHNIAVQLILPGATKTAMQAKSGADLHSIGWEKFTPVESVAGDIIHAIERNRFINTIGRLNALIRFAGHYLKEPVDTLIRWRTLRQTLPRGMENQGNEARRVAVITGAADGIGQALTSRLLARGYRVVGVDVDRANAAQMQLDLAAANQRLRFISGDLASTSAVQQIIGELEADSPVELIIHCAGISAVGYFGELDIARQQRVIDVNLRAPILMTANILRNGWLRSGGTLVFISSLSHYVGYPGAAAYAASKDGITSFARSLGIALTGQNINVLTVFPGPTRTAHARRYSPDNTREEKRMDPNEVAQRIIEAIEQRRRRLVPGIVNQYSAVLGRLFPRLFDHAMRRLIFDKLRSPKP